VVGGAGIVALCAAALVVTRGDDSTGPPPAASVAPTAAPGAPGLDTTAPTTEALDGGPPLGEPLASTVVAVDDDGTAYFVDLATGTVATRVLTVGVLEGQPITDVAGGPAGPLAVRSTRSRYQLVDLDDPWPREVEGREIVAYDDETGWTWFDACSDPPCAHYTRLRGYGPPGFRLAAVDLPAPTTRVVATAGVLFAEAAGSIVRIEPETGEQRVVAAGQLLDARASTLAVRSCAEDLSCPVYVGAIDGAPRASLVVPGDDVQLSPDGATLVTGAQAPSLATALGFYDVATGTARAVDPEALRFVTVPFAWSPDSQWIFAATATQAIVAVRVADGSVHRFTVPGLEQAILGLVVRDNSS
jgi:hypothetical protein